MTVQSQTCFFKISFFNDAFKWHIVYQTKSSEMSIENLLELVTRLELEYLQSSFVQAFSKDTYSSDWWLGDYT